MSEYKSLDQRLKAEGWEVASFYGSESITREMVGLCGDLMHDKYTYFCLVPAHLARDGEQWLIEDSAGHILYVKRSEEDKNKIAKERAVTLIQVLCYSVDDGEKRFCLID